MPWQQAVFKGQNVWAEVAQGKMKLDKGRVPYRYQCKASAKVYKASLANITLLPGEPVALGGKAAGKSGRGSGFGKAGTRTAAQAGAAKQAAQALLASLPEDTAICFTDGGCKGNPGPAGSGVVVTLPNGKKSEASRSLGVGTNNVAELTAIDMALDLLDHHGWDPSAKVAILTDSKYSNGVLCMGWKAKKNTQLILGIRAKLKARPGCKVHWIAGHVGVAGNERADALANDGVAGTTKTRHFGE